MSPEMAKLSRVITKADCYDYIDEIDDDSIDLVLTDVPYNILDVAWDNKDTAPFDIEKYIMAVAPKLKKTGTAVIFLGNLQITPAVNAFIKAGFVNDKNHQPELMVWEKTNAGDIRRKHKRQSRTFESYVVATKSTSNTFNLRLDTQLNNKNYESGILKYSANEDMQHRFHETQKPLSMWLGLLEMYSNNGDTVLDTFSGSGVTKVACMLSGRTSFACEKGYVDEKGIDYLESSRKRFKKAWIADEMPYYSMDYHPAAYTPKLVADKVFPNLPQEDDQEQIMQKIPDFARKIMNDLLRMRIEFYRLPKNYEWFIKAEKSRRKNNDRNIRYSYYYYLWFFCGLLTNERNFTDYIDAYFDSDTYEPIAVASKELEKFDILGSMDITAAQVEEDLMIKKADVKRFGLQYLRPRLEKAQTDETRFNNSHNYHDSKRDYLKKINNETKKSAKQMMDEYVKAGLSVVEFCRKNHISHSTFYKYKNLLKVGHVRQEAKR